MSLLKNLIDRFGGGAKRKIYICGGPTCCSPEEGRAAFERLERRVAELGLNHGDARVACHHADCMNVCGEGPIAFVRPEGTWYLEMAGERIDRVVESHLRDGQPVAEFAFDPPPDARPPN